VLDVMNEQWTPLVIRDVFVRLNHFDQIPRMEALNELHDHAAALG
jgi:DNA-binding HxlR family transcriptional regulator